MAKSKSSILIEKSIHALISSIEIYNKPDFKYREENFSILIVNAWELLLKAKILKDNNNNLRTLYIKDYLQKSDGTKSKRWKYKTTRSGNYLTKDIISCLNIIDSIEEKLRSNIITLVEIRDNSTHFYNNSIDFVKTIHEIGSASIYDYIHTLDKWFDTSLNNYNLYLLPLSFFGGRSIETIPLFDNEKKLLEYIKSKQEEFPYNKTDTTHYSFNVKVSLTKKSQGSSGLFLTNDPKATHIQLSDEELREKYPLTYHLLCQKCRSRYTNFKEDSSFHKLKSQYENDLIYCYKRYPSLNNSGTPRKFYSSAILEKFDKTYSKK